MSLRGTSLAATRTTTARCADCPAPPDGALDWLSSVVSLSVLPLVALVVSLGVVVLARNWLAAVRPRTASVLGYMLAVPLVVASLLGPDWVLNDLAFGGGLAVTVVVTLGRSRPIDRPGEALVYGVAVVLCIGLLSIVGQYTRTPIESALSAVLSGAFIASLYPLGVAFGHESSVWRRWVLGVGLSMALAVLWLMSSFVPFGGFAALLLPTVAMLVVAIFVLGLPVLAVGAGSQDRTLT